MQTQALYKAWFVDFEPFGGVMPSVLETFQIWGYYFNQNKQLFRWRKSGCNVRAYSIPAYDEQKYPVFESAADVKSNKYILTSNSVMISKLNPDTKRVWRPMCVTDFAVSSTEFIIFEANIPAFKDFVFSIIDSAAFSDWMCSHPRLIMRQRHPNTLNSSDASSNRTTLIFVHCYTYVRHYC